MLQSFNKLKRVKDVVKRVLQKMNNFRKKKLNHPFVYAVFTWLFGLTLVSRMRIIYREQQEKRSLVMS